MSIVNPLGEDLDEILNQTSSLWEEFKDQQIFITGGTGFFGCWILESFAWASDKLKLGSSALVLTRNPENFRLKCPHLSSHPSIKFQLGDVRSFDFPKGQFSHVIHAATDASSIAHQSNPLLVMDTIIEGTRRVLDFTVTCGAKKFLLISSGAVYGEQPYDLTNIPETYMGAPDPLNPSPRFAYGQAKRLAELSSVLYANQYGIETKIARCFSFIGPYFPLNDAFAIGNFIRDVIKGNSIYIQGDGTPYRSFLYTSDLVIWLWTILAKGLSCRAYNVGSEEGITIKDVAFLAAQVSQKSISVSIAKEPPVGVFATRYVPDTERVYRELKLKRRIDLPNALKKTIQWNSQKDDYQI